MKITKRILCLALSVMMALGCMSIAAFADDAASTTKDNSGAIKFSDVGDSEIYTDAVKTLNLMGVINGYPDGTFKPNDNVTRAEFTAIATRFATKAAEITDGVSFSDVKADDWFYNNVSRAAKYGFFNSSASSGRQAFNFSSSISSLPLSFPQLYHTIHWNTRPFLRIASSGGDFFADPCGLIRRDAVFHRAAI